MTQYLVMAAYFLFGFGLIFVVSFVSFNAGWSRGFDDRKMLNELRHVLKKRALQQPVRSNGIYQHYDDNGVQ